MTVLSMAVCRPGPGVRAAGACVFAAVIAGCATPLPSRLSAPEQAEAFRSRTLADPEIAALAGRAGLPAWPPAKLDGRALGLVAIENGQAVRLARAKWRSAAAAVRTAAERPNPTLSLNPLYVTSAAEGAPWMISASLVQMLETEGKRPLRVEKARYGAESARLETLAAAREAIQHVEAALVDLAATKLRLDALDAQAQAQQGLVDAAQKRLSVGAGSGVEVVSARATLDRTILDHQAATAALEDGRRQLAIAVGLPADQLPFDRLALPPLHQALPANFVAKVRQAAPLNRADLLARLADYAAAEAELRLQLAERTPNVELGPSFEYDQGARKWGVSLSSALPVFSRNQGAIGEAQAQRQLAAEQFTTAQATVIGEVDRAAAGYADAQAAFAVAERLYSEQARRTRAQDAQFARGEIDRVELLGSQAELAAAAVSQADAQGALAKAALAVETAGQMRPDGLDPASLIVSEGR